MGRGKEINMEIREIAGKGRGVFVMQHVPAGTFVVEYRTTKVYPKIKRQEHEAEYSMNEEPCMILEVQTPNGWHCLDATRRFETFGRLMNHARQVRQQSSLSGHSLSMESGGWGSCLLSTWSRAQSSPGIMGAHPTGNSGS